MRAIVNRQQHLGADVASVAGLAVFGSSVSAGAGAGAGAVGAPSGRDSALALAWLECNSDLQSDAAATLSGDALKLLGKHSRSVASELAFLQQVLLAAKVAAQVASPTHRKLLNLCHNWISTYMPHCLAKVNR